MQCRLASTIPSNYVLVKINVKKINKKFEFKCNKRSKINQDLGGNLSLVVYLVWRNKLPESCNARLSLVHFHSFACLKYEHLEWRRRQVLELAMLWVRSNAQSTRPFPCATLKLTTFCLTNSSTTIITCTKMKFLNQTTAKANSWK